MDILSIKFKAVIRLSIVCLLFGVAVSLSACTESAWRMPTQYHDGGIQVLSEPHQDVFDTEALSEDALYHIARHYKNNGDGEAKVTVTYDPQSSENTASLATRNLSRILSTMQKYGVETIDGAVLPVNERTETSRTLMTYNVLIAEGPEGCEEFPGLDHSTGTALSDYKFGCVYKDHMARQVARPGDLLGNENLDDPDARRQANIIDRYRAGEQREELEGETLSEIE